MLFWIVYYFKRVFTAILTVVSFFICGKIFSAYIPKSRIVGLQDKYMGFPDSSDGRESAYDTGDSGSIPGLGRSPGEGNGYPL